MNVTLDKRIVWRLPDGRVNITVLFTQSMLKNDTEDEFIAREIEKMKSHNPELSNIETFIKTKSELLNTINSHPEGHRLKLNCSKSGQLNLDLNIKLPQDLKKEKSALIKTKLKNQLNLTDEEIDLLIK